MEDTKFISLKEVSYRRAVGQCTNPKDKNSNQFFEVSPISESFSINFNPNFQIFPAEGKSKILSSLGSLTYMGNFSTVNLTRDPFDECYFKNIEFVFDFMIQDYTIIGSDKCVAVSRDGWISVAYESEYGIEKQGMSFQIHLETDEYVDCVVSDSSTNFICVATSKKGNASQLAFCEIIGDQEIFLVQSQSYFFSEDATRMKKISDMSTDMSFCGEAVLVVFESGPQGGILTLTVNDGAQKITKKSFFAGFFEEGFVSFATSEFTKIWTMDLGGTLKRITREHLLGIESEFNKMSPINSDDEGQTPYDWNNNVNSGNSYSAHREVNRISQVKQRGSNASHFQNKRARFDSLSDDEVVHEKYQEDEEDQYTSRIRLRAKKRRSNDEDEDDTEVTDYSDHRWNNCNFDEGVFTDDIAGINEGEEFEDTVLEFDKAGEQVKGDLNSLD